MDLLAATLAPELVTGRSKRDKVEKTGKNVILFFLTHAISFFAVYLSWNCSTQQMLPLATKVGWAVLAYCFGFLYVLMFAFKTRNACALLL